MLRGNPGAPSSPSGQSWDSARASRPWQEALRTKPSQIVLALGINDLAAGTAPADCVAGLETYLHNWQELAPEALLLLLAPAPLGALSGPWQQLFAHQQEASRELAARWRAVCRALATRLPLLRRKLHAR